MTATSDKPSKYVCPDCGRAYKAAETMNRHRKNHSLTAQYCCSVCPASFKRKDLLDRHLQIHVSGRSRPSRDRSQRACDRCSRLKTRCDTLTAPCTRCVKGGHQCTYKNLRGRARTDLSSSAASSSSSSCSATPSIVGSPPPMSAHELNHLVGGSGDDCSSPESSVLGLQTPPDEWIDPLWLHEPASWQWPVVDPSSLHAMAKPFPDQHHQQHQQQQQQHHHHHHHQHHLHQQPQYQQQHPIVLDPSFALNTLPLGPSLDPLYDDSLASMAWYQNPAVHQLDAASLDPAAFAHGCGNQQAHLANHHWEWSA